MKKIKRLDTGTGTEKRLKKHAMKCAVAFLKAVGKEYDRFELIRYRRVALKMDKVRVELTFIIKGEAHDQAK
jgi:hypothetical protein